jgi:hypothetical protein
MFHATCTQKNRGDSQLLVVGSQIVNLISSPSFGYNLCVKCPNGSWEPILDIYVLRSFQWYKELLNPMGFDPCNYFLKIWDSTGALIPKVGAHWECDGSFLHTLLHSREHEMWLPSFLLALTFASSRLGLWHIDSNWGEVFTIG